MKLEIPNKQQETFTDLRFKSQTACFVCVVFLCVVVGGLLSAHLLAGRGGMELEPGWPCSGPLLRMAEDAARKLLPGTDAHKESQKLQKMRSPSS